MYISLCRPLKMCEKTKICKKYKFSDFSSKQKFRKTYRTFYKWFAQCGMKKSIHWKPNSISIQKFSPHPQFVDQFIYICTYAKRKRKETLERLILEFGLLYSSLIQHKAQFGALHNNEVNFMIPLYNKNYEKTTQFLIQKLQ